MLIKTPAQRVVGQLALLMLPLVVLMLWGSSVSDAEDREDFVILATPPFAALFFTVLGAAIFSSLSAIYKRKSTEILKAYWLGTAFVFSVWLGCTLRLLY